MGRVTVQQYTDGNVGIRRNGHQFVLDQIRLVGTLEQVMDTLRWEFLGQGDSLTEEELERISWRVMQEVQ